MDVLEAEDRGRARALFGAALCLYGVLAWRFNWLCDDAYISFRYVRHLAEGEGLVFNPQRTPPVEGYSNFLWVVVLGALERIGIAAPLAARSLSALCGALTLWLLQRSAARRLGLGETAGALGALVVAALPPFSVWATSGLATMPAALALLACADQLLAERGRLHTALACLAAALCALLRADGAVWIAMLLGAHAIVALAGPRSERGWRLMRLATIGAVLAVTVGLHVGWRLSYYGDWLPLTARVKAGFSLGRLARGADYVASWLLILPAVAMIAVLASITFRRLSARTAVPRLGRLDRDVRVRRLGRWGLHALRPLPLPAIPFAGLLFSGFAARHTASGVWAALVCLGLSIPASFDWNAVPTALRQRFDFRPDRAWQSEIERWAEMNTNARRWVLLGRALDRHTNADESIILGGIGAVGYHCDLFIYDTYGLVTPEVVEQGHVWEGASPGHDLRVNPPFFFDRKPTYLAAYLTPEGGVAPDEALPWWTDFRPPDWETHRFGKITERVGHALDPLDGFPPSSRLVLVRMRD